MLLSHCAALDHFWCCLPHQQSLSSENCALAMSGITTTPLLTAVVIDLCQESTDEAWSAPLSGSCFSEVPYMMFA